MKPAMLIALACLTVPASLAMAQHRETGALTQSAAKPVNAMCPIGKEPIVPSAGTVEYKGKTIGLCCPGCGAQFLAWEESRKDEFVALAFAKREPGQGHVASAPVATWSDPYPLDTCPVSGGKLGSMGEPIVKMYDGREVRLCCAGCIGKFEADTPGYFAKIDERIAADQARFYPLATCVVSGEPLGDSAVDLVYGNRLVRLCCAMCANEFKADPAAFIAKIDKAAADAQRSSYPLTTCIVAGGKLGSMGEPTEIVVAGRLFRFCCAGCEPEVRADPAKHIATLDEAWRAAGKSIPGTGDPSQR